MKVAKEYTSSDMSITMEVLATYNPNEEPDTWIKYRNKTTLQEYTCRLEAFLSRFHAKPE